MKKAKYKIEANKFIIQNYNWAKPQANFFPGIAGKYGIPMWAYYVSRGQAVCALGINNKDQSLMEFLSFNKALDSVGRTCFRTFIKSNGRFYEPFCKTDAAHVEQQMCIQSGELELEDKNRELGLSVKVLYYPLVQSSVPAFVRQLVIQNQSDTSQNLEFLDGLARIIPYGMDRHCNQVTARHIEGMIEVADMEGLPLFRLKQAHADVEQIEKLQGGHFYLSLAQGKDLQGDSSYIVDPSLVFGDAAVYERAWGFEQSTGLAKLQEQKQIRFNKTPCAFSAQSITLSPGAQTSLVSVLGYAKNDSILKNFAHSLSQDDFLSKKRDENQTVIEGIKGNAFTLSAVPHFDEYIQQMLLDNVIRGGVPVPFDTDQGKSAFYIYSRQNGDLERDYHEFIIEPSYFSQGTGHYRSVNQNRRLDTWFFPEIYDYNIFLFMNLLQSDGYNPLELSTISYRITNAKYLDTQVAAVITDKALAKQIKQALAKDFTPGQLLLFLEEQGIERDQWPIILSAALSAASENESGAIHEGFWVDHWHYNLDLIDNFLAVYPEEMESLMFKRKNYTFFDNPDVLAPRSQKYMLAGNGQVRQYKAVVRDAAKQTLIQSRQEEAWKVRTKYGKGAVYRSNLAVKLLCLAANRLAALDPECCGVEMEADKPGWNDSMNGLPGLLGSSLCETIELERLMLFLRDVFQKDESKGLNVFPELYDFITKLTPLMAKRIKAGSKANFEYWQTSRTIKERYTKSTLYGIGSPDRPLKPKQIADFLQAAVELLREAVQSGSDSEGVTYTYLENQAVKWEKIKKGKKEQLSPMGMPLLQVNKFRQRPLARFLEGSMHMLRVHPELRQKIYRAVKASDLYDTKLKMYKVCGSLKEESFEIGRVKAWPSGWIENESVYTHMVYKYLLEILRSGLHNEFFEDMKTHFTCFLAPETYGRSIFENVSFIVSSVYEDSETHGQGFQARLSGVTSEVLHIWTLMVSGPRPFRLRKDGSLCLCLEPALAAWLFTTAPQSSYYRDEHGQKQKIEIDANCFAFRFMRRCLVVYHNPQRKDTFDPDLKIRSYELSYVTHKDGGQKVSVSGPELNSDAALAVRNGQVARMDVHLE